MQNLIKNIKTSRAANAAAAGQTEVVGATLDMQGYDGVMGTAILGDVTDTCVLTLKAYQGAQSDMSDENALTGVATKTAGATDADNKLLVLDVFRPTKRYVRFKLTRTTANAVVDGILAQQYRPGVKPPATDATVVASNLIISPAHA